ncbi:methyl-accepting chemotaxis protein [Caulobacter segnis]|uniref:Methyl-accepting chemotaxis protein n=1 Tax=Caulobacter segnis TaxID=88688 RepID=A0A2W5X7Q0_9CAUL|nr:methyl-accepting chemotaxis protein [Caulobacter segnis]PZR32941.1 MAG: methyl-accepting chemotaxis protein [Caulobacter segnis]
MRLTIKLQLAAAFGVLILLLLGGNLFASNALNDAQESLDAVMEKPVKRMEIAQEINIHLLNIVRAEKNMVLSDDVAEIRKFEASVVKEKATTEALLEKAKGLASAEGKPRWLALETAYNAMAEVHARVFAFALENKDDEATVLTMGESRKAITEAIAKVDELVQLSNEQMTQASDDAEKAAKTAHTLLLTISGVSLLIAVGAALYISMLVSKGLARASEAVRTVAEGDLTKTAEITSRDEIGDLLGNVNVMIERLRGIVGDAVTASENVSSGSQELSATSEQMSQGATEQAAAAEQASASMEEMAANIKQNADNAAQTEKIARQSAQDAETSGQAVNKAVDAMQTIAEKITIVQEIARQTDLLALNAAVEAARAGEHGRGFAVVASEVRKLAERSQTAAAEISAVSSDTVKAAQTAGEMLTSLVPNIRKTAELVSEISAACREQDIGASQINEAIQQLDKVTQQNASASEEMSATSEELAAQAEELQTSIAYFRTDSAHGRRSAPRPAARRPSPVAKSSSAAKPASKAPTRSPVAAQQARAAGFALDLASGGPDADDADFREYA